MAEKMTKAELRAKAESLVLEYNEAIQKGDFNAATKIDEAITEAINEYTSIARSECFEELKKTDDPMLEAIKRLTFATIKAKDEKVGEEKIPVRSIIDVDKVIDLLKLHKSVPDGIGYDKKWNFLVEKVNFLMTAQKAIDLGIKPQELNDSYAMSAIAKEIDLGKTPTSKTNILKTIQAVVTAMIGEEYKATSHDVNFLLSVYSHKNRKALTVSCANHRYMRQYLMEICHRIVMGKSYELEYKKLKK